jgi:ABC-type Fe3+/spermidine/putrescine transport system ATPase subunit
VIAESNGMSSRRFDGHGVAISGIQRSFGSVVAVNNVSLEISAGEFVAILGPSGCGKTTLLRMIAGLEYPDAGRILIDGRDVTNLPANRRRTNLVFQNGALFPHRSVFENVAYPLQRRRMPRSEVQTAVERALAMVQMSSLGTRRPRELSGGQAQRVALARALVAEPAVLLLDEPLSALDLMLRKEMQLELRSLQEDLGTTFIYVTHDQEEALTMASRIVIMRDGNVIQDGTPREIYENPGSVFASTFIGASNLLFGEVAGRHDGVTLVRVADHELRVSDPRELSLGTRVALSIRPERIKVAAAGVIHEDWNRLPAAVVESVFLGNRIRLRTVCANTTVWVESSSSEPGAGDPSSDTPTIIGWAIADANLLVADEVEAQ